MCYQTIMIYSCRCGHVATEMIPFRICEQACQTQKGSLRIDVHQPCQKCREANTDIFSTIQGQFADHSSRNLRNKPLPGIPGPGPTEGSPPSYEHVSEQVPTYAQSIAEEQPVTFDDITSAILYFDPDQVVSSWYAFRALQISLLEPLCTQVQVLQHRIGKARRRVHRLEDIGYCDEVMIRLAREQSVLNTALEWGRRYLDAALVLKYGLDRSREAASQATKAGNHIEATSHVGAAAEHADKLLEIAIQLSRPGRQPQPLEANVKKQIHVLEAVLTTLESRTTSRAWAFLRVGSRSNFDVHC